MTTKDLRGRGLRDEKVSSSSYTRMALYLVDCLFSVNFKRQAQRLRLQATQARSRAATPVRRTATAVTTRAGSRHFLPPPHARGISWSPVFTRGGSRGGLSSDSRYDDLSGSRNAGSDSRGSDNRSGRGGGRNRHSKN